MPKRKRNPETGEPKLTAREHRLVEAYVANGGNGTRAAISAGYSPNSAGQIAHEVLARSQVQARIEQRLAQTRVTAEEVLGTLAIAMRSDPGDCFDQQGRFSLDLARQNGLGPLLKVRATVRRKCEPDGKMRDVAETTTVELDSPLAGAVRLAGVKNIDAAPVYEPKDTSRAIEALIASQMEKHNLTRSAVVKRLVEIRPDIAQYLTGALE